MVIATKEKYQWQIKEFYTKVEKPLTQKVYYYDFLDKYLAKLKRKSGENFDNIGLEIRGIMQ
jgi:hypothetical protein